MTAPPSPPASSTVCPSCGAAASGKFCSECGASLGGGQCASCKTDLITGARYCHRCGLPANAAVPPAESQRGQINLPWIVAGIALLAMISLVAGQRFAANRPATPAAPETAPDVAPFAGRAPDISALTPAQRAIRLYDRLMQYDEAGKPDSVKFFAPMALAAYEMLGTLDLDGHYDVGRIGEISGDPALAAAEADTILKQNPNHLLGLTLAAHAATMQNRSADARKYFQRLIAAEPAERKKQIPEYITHEHDVDAALNEARLVVRR
jgi:tetratricopeptide (TPR) repeat protein